MKNSYSCDIKFFKANSDKSLQMVALSLSCLARTKIFIIEENQLVSMKIDINIIILYFGSRLNKSLTKGSGSLGLSIRKLNNLANAAITIISEIPPRIASGNKDINSLFLDFGR